MRKISETSIMVVCLAIGFIFTAFPVHAVEDDVEVVNEELGQTYLEAIDIEPKLDAYACEIYEISLETIGGTTIYSIPRGQVFRIWARWTCPKKGYTIRTKILNVRGLNSKYTYMGKTKSTSGSHVGSGNAHAIEIFAYGGQWVKVKASVTDRGSLIKWFRVK